MEKGLSVISNQDLKRAIKLLMKENKATYENGIIT